MALDGLLLIDKPSGPTSHDVVARLRQTTGERSVGHTGTLDPRATGLLPLVLGRATRLASFFSGSEKTYEATIRFGFATDTDDAAGTPLGVPTEERPSDSRVDEVLNAFRGTFSQLPSQHSAKKVDGAKAYDLARRGKPVDLAPVTVTVHLLEFLDRSKDDIRVRVRVSAGFYVRALARDVGSRLGCGAHLSQLRRTACGGFDIDDAITLAEAERLGRGVDARILSPADALTALPAVRVTDVGFKRVIHGNTLAPEHLVQDPARPSSPGQRVRVLGPGGALLAVAESRGAALHPVVVLG